MAIDEPAIRFRPSNELFLVRGKLVAQQPSYQMAFMKEDYYEVRNYYCPDCGEVWGKRVDTNPSHLRHRFIESKCSNCGGEEHMLSPFEKRRIDLLSTNVLAYFFLTQAQRSDHES